MRLIFVVGCLLAAVQVQGQQCPRDWYPRSYECPQDCGKEEDFSRGCIQCTCGGQVVEAMSRCYPSDSYYCPPFCAVNPEIVDSDGCLSCTCGATPIPKCPPLTDQECPNYCTRSTDADGCETCDCNTGTKGQQCPRDWYPQSYECPQDCGKEEDFSRGCIQCTCGGQVVEAMSRCYPSDSYYCPPFCAVNPEIVDSDGCLSCSCGATPIPKCTPLTDQECPNYCSRSTDADGCETCDCNTGTKECSAPWYPAGSTCPADCGQEEERGCIRCSCGAEPLPPCFSRPDYACPPFCGTEILDGNGCLSCSCGATPISVI